MSPWKPLFRRFVTFGATFGVTFGGSFVAVYAGLTIASDFSPYKIDTVAGESMQPTLNPSPGDKDVILLRRLSCDSGDCSRLARGDVVDAFNPRMVRRGDMVVKRLVGLPGDTLSTPMYREDVVKVQPGFCWLEGDNPAKSADSNFYGPVSLDSIQGKAVAIIWPPSRIGRIPHRPNASGDASGGKRSKLLHSNVRVKTERTPHPP